VVVVRWWSEREKEGREMRDRDSIHNDSLSRERRRGD
jgi:hypothetical protein